MDYDAYDAILHHIFKLTQDDAWLKPTEENLAGGICLRVEPGHFRVFPYENQHLAPFEAAVRSLNPVVAVKIRSAAVNAALATTYVNPVDKKKKLEISCPRGNSSDADIALFIDQDTKIQILETMSRLPRAEKEQRGAFIVRRAHNPHWLQHISILYFAFSATSVCLSFGPTILAISSQSLKISRTNSSSLFGAPDRLLHPPCQLLLRGPLEHS